jgi:hypothetical protein
LQSFYRAGVSSEKHEEIIDQKNRSTSMQFEVNRETQAQQVHLVKSDFSYTFYSLVFKKAF